MPKAAKVPTEVLTAVVVDHVSEIIVNGEIAKPTAQIWKRISEALDNMLSTKAIYTFIKLNRQGIHSKLNYSVKECFEDENQSLSYDNDFHKIGMDNSDISEAEDEFTQTVNSPNLHFVLKIDSGDWEKIKPTKTIYKCSRSDAPQVSNREYTVFQSGWTDIVNYQFWRTTSLPCSLSFKRAKVNPGSESFAKITGICKECKSNFEGKIKSEPLPNAVTLVECNFSGDFESKHSNKMKRKLRGEYLKKATDSMCEKGVSASAYRRLQAHEDMEFDGFEPSHIPTNNALRIAKYREMQKNRFHEDPILAISIAKGVSHYQDAIRDIGYNRFFVHYWTAAQLHVYRAYCTENPNSTICIDATGSVVRTVSRANNRKSGSIFLYEVTVRDEYSNMQYSVCNMLSERHDTNSIHHWLAEWVRSGASVPKNLVCDMSLALLSASIHAFTNFRNVSTYTEECSKILRNEENDLKLPDCFVRCDIAHIVKSMCSWSCLRGTAPRIRQFYLRSMGQVLQSDNLHDIESLLYDIFCVAFSQSEGEITHIEGIFVGETGPGAREPTRCERAKQRLKIRFATGRDSLDDSLLRLECVSETPNEIEVFSTTHFKGWVEGIAERARIAVSLEEGDRDNMQYLPAIEPAISNLMSLMPLVTAVMVPYYGTRSRTASSAPVESSYNDLKHRVFRNKELPLRLDEFLLSHILSLDGTMKLAAARNREKYPQITDFSAEKKASKEKQPNSDIFLVHISSADENGANMDKNYETKSPAEETRDKISSFIDLKCNNSKRSMCPACSRGDLPGGAHRCKFCHIPIHALDECSEIVMHGGSKIEEGYGQERMCYSCKAKTDQGRQQEIEKNACENWRGQSLPPKKRQRTSYLEPNSEFLNINFSESSRNFKIIGILKNGNKSELKPLRIEKQRIILSNTCGFDAIVQLICVGYCDSLEYKKFVQHNLKDHELLKLVQSMTEHGVTLSAYKLRAKILKNIFSVVQLPSNIKKIDTVSTCTEMANKILKGFPTVKRISNCSSGEMCDTTVTSSIVAVVNFPENNLDSLEARLQNILAPENTKCLRENSPHKSKCVGQRKTVCETSRTHILIEPLLLQEMSHTDSSDIFLPLKRIPSFLVISKTKYILRGVVGFYGSSITTSVGHFVAHCCRLGGSWETYDDLKDSRVLCSSSTPQKIQMLFYTI